MDSKELEAYRKNLGAELRDSLPQSVGFILLLFEREWLTYVSTEEREKMIDVLRKTIDKLEEHERN
jgi:hypothetical protein